MSVSGLISFQREFETLGHRLFGNLFAFVAGFRAAQFVESPTIQVRLSRQSRR